MRLWHGLVGRSLDRRALTAFNDPVTMSDTQRLHSRLLLALALTPGVVAGCDKGSSAPETTAKAEPMKVEVEVEEIKHQDTKIEPVGVQLTPTPPPPPPEPKPEPPRPLPVGSCPNGDWCASTSAVKPLAVETLDGGGDGPILGCTSRFSGMQVTPELRKDEVYASLPTGFFDARMNQPATEKARADGDAEACCYHWVIPCPGGRPLLDAEGHPRLAPLHVAGPGDDWTEPRPLDPMRPECSPALAERLAGAWREDARMEHASVASFARVTLELMALGAPADLVEGAQRAGLDEIRHAQQCLAIARTYDGQDRRPGPFPMPEPEPVDLVSVAVRALVEGGVAETGASLMAERAAASCRVPTIAACLRRIADEEAEHAALAWRTVAWALREGGERVASALRKEADALERALGNTEPTGTASPELAEHGRLDAPVMARARRDAWQRIAGPLLRRLLAEPAAA